MPTDHLQAWLATALADRYTLLRELGAGGMATVFLAHDIRHDRRVAIKLLHPELSAVLGGERFLVEIKTTAALQHPHILPLFDSGSAEGHLYYVMPFVEGETLRGRLVREKQLPVDEAVRIATQVASALDYAHRHGVVHRDVKPENILLQDGQALVADFGIALAIQQAGGQRMTQTGLSLGTPQYMAPEQAMGEKTIDARADVYALGAVTYEMLMGEPPFSGPSAQAIVAKVMTEEPQRLTSSRKSIPAHIEAAVLKALEKLPADRFASAAQFATALATPGVMPRTTARSASSHRRELAVGSVVALLLAIATAGWLRPSHPEPVIRYALALDSAEALVHDNRWGRLALSPDGSELVYIGGPKGMLLLRRRDEMHAKAIPGTEGALGPFFSPDGKRIGFFRRKPSGAGEIFITTRDDSSTVMVTDTLVGLAGATWTSDDEIYADGDGSSPLVRVAAHAGAKPEWYPVLDSARGESDALVPNALPGGRGLLYTAVTGVGQSRKLNVYVTEGSSTQHHLLIEGARDPHYVDPGYLVYNRGNKLMVAPFDLRKLRVSGDPTVVDEHLADWMDFAVSRSGRLAYVAASGPQGEHQLVRVASDGRADAVDSVRHTNVGYPAVSPDGQRIAFAAGDRSASVAAIWVKRLGDGVTTRVTMNEGLNLGPVWTGDSQRVLYVSYRPDSEVILERRVDGIGTPIVRATSREYLRPYLAVSADGQWVVYGTGPYQHEHLFARRNGDTAPIRLVPDPTPQRQPALSPDGRWLAYVTGSDDAVGGEVWIVPFPNTTSARWLVTSRGEYPVWSRDGRKLYVIDSGVVSVPISVVGSAISVGAPTTVLRSLTGYNVAPFAVSPTDDRPILVRAGGSTGEERLTIVENWAESLGRRR